MLLEISGEDITQLRDDELRNLIGLHCEADYRLENLPVTSITWGGHQDAKDGGVDVRISNTGKGSRNGFIQSSAAVLQVKKHAMPAGKISKEMRPKGLLLESIKEMIELGGTYIIISAKDHTSDKALKSRIEAMREAVSEVAGSERLSLDFYDRNRIATWVRKHPSLILWVRAKTEKPLNGWHPYRSWSNPSIEIGEEYLIDKRSKFWDRRKETGQSMSVLSGINRMRQTLCGKGSFRLVGLSGVGKTRFVQALFDERIGNNALSPSDVIYCDIGDQPTPTPSAMLELLASYNYEGIVIVDNCNPQTHRSLSTAIKRFPGISLLTIEYDVSDFDLPEETGVFELEAADEELITSLIRNRYKSISFQDANTISENAHGNSRIALALADALQSERTISSLSSKELFERLFFQRNEKNEQMLLVGQMCSLVYSFQGVDYTSVHSEIVFLASLCSITPFEFYRQVKEIEKRKMIQSRSEWRAVLPHAIANKLALGGLDLIGADMVFEAFMTNAPERLLVSFTRRLQFLHESPIARSIVDRWFAIDGRFGDLTTLDHKEIGSFFRVASICPEKALTLIEAADRKVGLDNLQEFHYGFNTGSNWSGLLAYLAHDAGFFKSSTVLLIKFVLRKMREETNPSSRTTLLQLFQISGSGTHASVEDRGEIIEGLLMSETAEERSLGLELLKRTFETDFLLKPPAYRYISPAIRDDGWQPKTIEEGDAWFLYFADLMMRFIDQPSIRPSLRSLFAHNLRILWGSENRQQKVMIWAKQIRENEYWVEGWSWLITLKRTYGKEMDAKSFNRLVELEKILQPQNLFEQVQAYVLPPDHMNLELFESDDEKRIKRRDTNALSKQKAIDLGKLVALDKSTLHLLESELFSSSNYLTLEFGFGLCQGATDTDILWQWLSVNYSKADSQTRQLRVIWGFTKALSESAPDKFDVIMDALVSDPHIGPAFPYLQTIVPIESKELQRLHLNLDSPFCNVSSFKHLNFQGRQLYLINAQLESLLERIIEYETGPVVALEILSHRIDADTKLSKQLKSIARQAFLRLDYPQQDKGFNSIDHQFHRLASVCYHGDEAKQDAVAIFRHIRTSDDQVHGSIGDYPNILEAIALNFPDEFLDEYLTEWAAQENRLNRDFGSNTDEADCFHRIGLSRMAQWTNDNPIRLVRVLRVFPIFLERDQSIEWHETIEPLVNDTKHLSTVLDELSKSLYPSAWTSGMRSSILKKRKPLLEFFLDNENATVANWAATEIEKLDAEIDAYADEETMRETREAQSFE